MDIDLIVPHSTVTRLGDERGMTTAEYAVGTVSACGFGGLLFKLLTSDFGEGLLKGILDNISGLLPF